jgi:hypothetical protein
VGWLVLEVGGAAEEEANAAWLMAFGDDLRWAKQGKYLFCREGQKNSEPSQNAPFWKINVIIDRQFWPTNM